MNCINTTIIAFLFEIVKFKFKSVYSGGLFRRFRRNGFFLNKYLQYFYDNLPYEGHHSENAAN